MYFFEQNRRQKFQLKKKKLSIKNIEKFVRWICNKKKKYVSFVLLTKTKKKHFPLKIERNLSIKNKKNFFNKKLKDLWVEVRVVIWVRRR